MTPDASRKLLEFWRRHLRPILVLILIFTACRSSLFDWNDVPSGSMEPSIFIGDRIFVNKLAYGLKFPFTTWHLAKWSGPQRGEVVVFYSPEPEGTRLVKRVIGLPGDHIDVLNGHVKITDAAGQVVPVTYEDASPSLSDIPVEQQRKCSFQTEHIGEHSHLIAHVDRAIRMDPHLDGSFDVPEGHYFMMGDNRDNSRDSRFIGPAPRSQILGRASRVIFSLDYDDMYLPRKGRFFHGLP